MRHTRRRLPAALLALGLVLGAAACGDDGDDTGVAAGDDTPTTGADAGDEAAADAPTEVEVAHAQGTTTVPFQPETVVVYDLGTLATLTDLGVEVAGLPDFVGLPDEIADAHPDATTVGTLFEPDLEAVNALEPDLIIVATRSAASLPDLSEIAPTIDLTVAEDDFLGSFADHTRSLGEIFGVQDEVDAALAEIEADVDEVAAMGAEAGPALIVLTSAGEVTAYGPGSRFGLIHDTFMVPPAVEDVEAATHGEAISFEFIAEAAPEILYVLDRDATIGEEGQAAEQVLDNEIVAGTPAWTDGAVTYLDGFAWYIAPNGLPSVRSMIDDVRSSLE